MQNDLLAVCCEDYKIPTLEIGESITLSPILYNTYTETDTQRTLKHHSFIFVGARFMTNEELVLEYRSGNKGVLETLYSQNIGMIERIIGRYKGVEDPEDLRQEAYFGLVRAADLWDPEREAQFLTFAVICIKSVLHRYIAECGSIIKVPEYQKTLIYKYDRCMNEFRARLGRDATPEELRALLEISKEQLEQLKRDRVTLAIRSTNEVIGGDDDDITLEDTLQAEGDQYEDAIDRIQKEQLSRELWAQVDKLPEREASVVRGKYLNGETYSQSGERLGVSQERIRQLHARALRTLRGGKARQRLLPYLSDSAAYSIGSRTGLSYFKQNHTTGQERAVMLLEEKTGPIWQRIGIREDIHDQSS